MSSLIGLQLWSSRWHYFHKSTEQGGVGGESEKTPCSMNVQKFSIVFWLAKELCCKGWLCFVPCLTFPHNQTISAFLYLYNPIQRLPFTLLQPLFLSLISQRYLLSLAKEQIDNTPVFFSKSKKNLEIKSFLTSQRIGYLSLFSRKRRFFSLHIFSLHTEEYERKKRKITTSRFWRICEGVWKGFSMFDPDFETVWGKSWNIPDQLQLSRLTQGEVRWAKGEKYTEHLWQIHVTTLTNPFSDLDNRWSDHQVDKDDWDDQDNHRGVDDLDNCQDHRDCEA